MEPPGRTPGISPGVFVIALPTSKETEMNKSNLSLLMVALMAASGLAAAQPQTTPAMAGTQGGSGPSAAQTAAPGNMPNTRAEVKAQIGTGEAKAGTQGGSGPSAAQTAAPGNMPNSRADVKADAMNNKATSGIQGGSAASPAANANTKNLSTTTAEERQVKRADRKARAKAKRDAKANAAASAKPADPMMKDSRAQ
jgi:hypothetical protein